MNQVESAINETLRNYSLIKGYKFSKNNDKEFLSDSVINCCRFCGRSFPVVSFKEEAHVIPEFIGNKKLFSKFECDECNHFFSKYETEFAEYMLPHNALSGTVSKKNKIPKFKKKGQPLIENTPESINISDVINMDLSNINGKGLDINIKISPYIPEYIYRCLVKIAISIIPESKLRNYKDTISWLMNVDQEASIKPFMVFSMYPFQYKMEEIFCAVFERLDSCLDKVPFSIFVLSYKNFAFQICLPNTLKEFVGDQINGTPFIFPTRLDFNQNCLERRTNHIIDLSCKEKKSEIVNYNIKSDEYSIKEHGS